MAMFVLPLLDRSYHGRFFYGMTDMLGKANILDGGVRIGKNAIN